MSCPRPERSRGFNLPPSVLCQRHARAFSYSRRPGHRFNRGRVVTGGSGAPAAETPLSIFGSLSWWVDAALGVTTSGSDVTAWADQIGGNWAPASTPQLISNALGANPAVELDGAGEYFTKAMARAAPGTQPFYVCLVCAQLTWTLNDNLYHDGGGGLFCSPTTPSVRMFNGSSGPANSAGTINNYKRFELQCGNSTSDYLKVGVTNQTGTNTGNAAGTGTIAIGANPAGTGPANLRILEAFCFLGTASAGQRSANDARILARYGAGLT